VLVSESERPLPKQRELTIGSLDTSNNKNDKGERESSESLSSDELELMTAMDKADSLLNAGSFQVTSSTSLTIVLFLYLCSLWHQDFDEMIGDTNDPRLLNAKEIMTTPGDGYLHPKST
jgi:hypothetical protein